ncbi:MAG: M48 family metalloprotease [Methylophilus sp.]|nr:M48 family metalloprotease [Methylophilus sp.]MDP3607933.1 M48 family metalloprotease [Methylophilus sp.]
MHKSIFAALVTTAFIANVYAFDLGKALEGAVKEKIQETTGTKTEPANTDNADNQNAVADTPTAQPQINWKSPSRDEEVAIGREVTGSLLGAAPLVKNDDLQQYVNKVGRWVASQSERPDLPWKFGVIESNDLNAFAAPGGYVLITKGLYQTFQNEAQLAGVLGHEIAHVVQKHHLKVMQKQALLDMGAGLLGDKFGDNKLSKKAISTGAEISARNLDKSAEYEADRIGMMLAYRAGYDVYGLPEVLQNMAQINKSDDSVALLFKTHPHPDERLAQLGESAGSQLDKLKAGKTLENRLYLLR